MEANALSLAARALRNRLATALGIPEGQILIGQPASAATLVEGQGAKQFLNLFFYRVEHDGYPADATSDVPTYLRAHCLVTAFGSDEGTGSSKVTAGENDLKILGAVVACLHQQPILLVREPATNAAVSLQVVPEPFPIESVNNLWSTQVNTSYRPSVAYQLALAPAPFKLPVEPTQRVGEVVLDVRAPAAASAFEEVTGPKPEWVPEVRFVVAGALHEVLSFSVAEAPASLSVAVAGKVGAPVQLKWEIWAPSTGWRTAPTTTDAAVTIDRATLGVASPQTVSLPETGLTEKRQFALRAVFSWTLPSGLVLPVKSNLLLVSVYRGGA